MKKITLYDVVMAMVLLEEGIQKSTGDYTQVKFPSETTKRKFRKLERDIERYGPTATKEEAAAITVDKQTAHLYQELMTDKSVKEYVDKGILYRQLGIPPIV